MKRLLLVCILLVLVVNAFGQRDSKIDSAISKLDARIFSKYTEDKSPSQSAILITHQYFFDSVTRVLYKVIETDERNKGDHQLYSLRRMIFYYMDGKLVKVSKYLTGGLGCIMTITDYYFDKDKLVKIDGFKSRLLPKEQLLKTSKAYLEHFTKRFGLK